MSKLDSRKGFDLKPNPTDDLPFAVALLRTRSDLPIRSYRSPDLLKGPKSERIQNLDADLKYAMSKACEVFKLSECVPVIHLNDIFAMDLEIRGSSPGIPWQRDYKTKGDIMDSSKARTSIRWYWSKVKKGEPVDPLYTRVLYRAHSMDDNTLKIQEVCEYPATMTFGEAQFALPLIEAYKKGTTPMIYGYDMNNGSVLKLGHELIKFDHYYVDFLKFNERVSDQLIDYAFDILELNINFVCYKHHGVPDVRKLFCAWRHITDYFKHILFNHTVVRLSNGDRCEKIAGIPSDSYFTQLIGSIVNYICLSYVVLKSTGRMPRFIREDDAVIVTHSIDQSEWARIMHCLGMELQGIKFKEE